MLLYVCIFLSVLPPTFSNKLGNDDTGIFDLEKVVNKLIDSKIKKLELVSRQDLSELESRLEAKTKPTFPEVEKR